MNTKRSVRIVKGYHEATPIPERAANEGLLSRFAVILPCFYGDLSDSDIDWKLFFAILNALSGAIPHDGLAAECRGPEGFHFGPVDVRYFV